MRSKEGQRRDQQPKQRDRGDGLQEIEGGEDCRASARAVNGGNNERNRAEAGEQDRHCHQADMANQLDNKYRALRMELARERQRVELARSDDQDNCADEHERRCDFPQSRSALQALKACKHRDTEQYPEAAAERNAPCRLLWIKMRRRRCARDQQDRNQQSGAGGKERARVPPLVANKGRDDEERQEC